MTPPKVSHDTEFDRYADAYDSALERGISVSGEDRRFFAHGRMQWLDRCLRPLGVTTPNVMDFGCGTGSATPYLLSTMGAERVVGVDVSERSLTVARREYGAANVQFIELASYQPAAEVDLVFCNGVFHHIPLEGRAVAMDTIVRALRPGGWFALWENNPWNPGARWVMKRIPFDRDAVVISAPEARRLVRTAGLEVMRTDFLFIFPRLLKFLRACEPALSALPLGAQYQVLARKKEA
jgi:SAM-dependent methyltransferase